jgi:tRNA 2-thiouridine synthesizing protein A
VVEAIRPDEAWDAGELGCGELVIVLFLRLRALPPGARFLLTATDPGAVHDIPAWCRLTGHALLSAEPPHFLIQRKA